MNSKKVETTIANRKIIVECDTLAFLSNSAVKVTYGNTVILATVDYNNKVNIDFFPLTVVFQEKLYSIGKIPGGFLKREGKASDYSILCSRLIDRSIRPLFATGFQNEVQIINSVFAFNEDDDSRFAASIATSIALNLSELPFLMPNAIVVIGYIDNAFILNPTKAELEVSTMELIVGGTAESINMVEGSCAELSEATIIKALAFAFEAIKKITSWQQNILEALKPQSKLAFNKIVIPTAITEFVITYFTAEIALLATQQSKKDRQAVWIQIEDKLQTLQMEKILPLEVPIPLETQIKLILKAIDEQLKNKMRHNIITTQKRIDNRDLKTIRPLHSSIDILPIVHGSGLFQRGQTQVLSIVTLGALEEQQIIEDLGMDEYKRFMHHYNFPPFSVGEVKRMLAPSRREIGHGSLGWKALNQIIPSETDFPYTIRVVSEVLSSNGSTSQAAICASSLALMASGVPIKQHVAGIAMGLIQTDNDENFILTDIQGLEDHLGDMDFKIAGSRTGICALQMDIKVLKINFDVFTVALADAKLGREQILTNMEQIILKPRTKLAPNAPKFKIEKIPAEKIGEIIGSGGKTINKIIAASSKNEEIPVKIDLHDDGKVILYHKNDAVLECAWNMIQEISFPKPVIININVGDEFTSKVVAINNFGVFVNLMDNIDGMIHISKFSQKYERKIINLHEVVKINDEIKVKVLEIKKEPKLKISLDFVK